MKALIALIASISLTGCATVPTEEGEDTKTNAAVAIGIVALIAAGVALSQSGDSGGSDSKDCYFIVTAGGSREVCD